MSVADNENVYTESTFPFSLGSLPNMALAFRATGGCEKDNLISLRAAP